MKRTMELATEPVADQVKRVVQTVVEVFHAARAERQSSLAGASPLAVATSPEAAVLRDEMLKVGRKLWDRSYVDGNGGNLSVRIGPDYVLCTPTMVSKADMVPADICLCDLNGDILAGNRLRTSEILLHVEIYKANPRARAVVHCHPPYATAFAVAGTVPPNGYVTEYELMIGPAALAPYETPGTKAFAQTVLPFVEHHNTILLANHGIVCWSDTVTHAEWLVEIMDSYCKTYLLAKQVGTPLQQIPENMIDALLETKRKLGLPDARLPQKPASKTSTAEIDKLVKDVVARMEAQE